MCNMFTQSAARKLLQGSIGNLSQDCLWPIAQNANDYQVLDSTFCRFDCDCFIHSMHSSTVPLGCASCHFSTRCCCNKKQVFYHGFSGSRISLIWGKGRVIAYPFSYQWTSFDLHNSHNRLPVEYRLQLPHPIKIWTRETINQDS